MEIEYAKWIRVLFSVKDRSELKERPSLKGLECWLEEMEIRGRIENIQTTTYRPDEQT